MRKTAIIFLIVQMLFLPIEPVLAQVFLDAQAEEVSVEEWRRLVRILDKNTP